MEHFHRFKKRRLLYPEFHQIHTVLKELHLHSTLFVEFLIVKVPQERVFNHNMYRTPH